MTLQKRQRITSWPETRETICSSASDSSMGKTVKKIKIFFTYFFLFCFSTDQSEVELLYFSSSILF
jgi:hypothetical protein